MPLHARISYAFGQCSILSGQVTTGAAWIVKGIVCREGYEELDNHVVRRGVLAPL
jgi:hypothetical protein